MITGLNIKGLGLASIGVEAQLLDQNSYLLFVKCSNALLIDLQIIRMMIDRSLEGAQTTRLHMLSLQSGTVNHYTYKDSILTPYQIKFYSDAFFYGIVKF